ncbi:hypothetical protein [Pedobacter sp. Leaf176]|uniref:hypothetical protein n=1 Tax=Pedobacter sp. Leaf176 TaxID=1736286 RepID=UPI0006FC6BFF|nr:hypothetical protein [Pedobacter sp. Leaf176]KQR67243.1 hypothetical protein ASF92_16160 [Pedobacter sp. Leaf176]
MALWHYSFIVIPKEETNMFVWEDKFKNSEYGFDDAPFWDFKLYDKSVFYELSKILPREDSWHSNIELYGNENSNNIEVYVDFKRIKSVSLRIDFRSNYSFILIEIIEFFILNGFTMLDENLELVILNFEIIKSIIDNSSQFKKYNELSVDSKS